MNDHEKRAEVRVPVALRIRLRYQAVDQFISKFAVNLSRGGMFLSSRNPKPPGTELYFEIRLADESPVIEGTGVVRWIREYNRHRPDEPHGMGIQFADLSEESRQVLERVIEHRRSIGEGDEHSIPEPRATIMGLGPTAPIPASLPLVVLAAQAAGEPRAGDGGERGEPARGEGTRGAGTRGEGTRGDGEDDDKLRGEILRALSRPAVALRPAAVAASARPAAAVPVAARPSAAVAAARPVAARLFPSAARGDELPVVRAAMTRARALTGAGLGDGQLERELAELLEESAVPVEITVDEASRELAERLGGSPVERRRRQVQPVSAPSRESERAAAERAAAERAERVAAERAAAERAAAERAAAERAAAPNRAMSPDEALVDVASEDLTADPQAATGANGGEGRGGDDPQGRMAAAADHGGVAMTAPPSGPLDPMPGDGRDPGRRGLLQRLLRSKS
jgi:uncharacterized protein (TIGR02266 family)